MQPSDGSTQPDASASGKLDSESHASSLRLGLYILTAFMLFVAGWLFVFWLFHENQDPHSLVQGMQQPGRRSWQKAYALSQLLLDPDYDHLKDDSQLCQALSNTLVRQNQLAEQLRQQGEAEDEELAQFRAFLCRALGEFRLRDGLPPLLECAAADTSELPANSQQREVRRAAIEALAVLARNIGVDELQDDAEVIAVLITASRDLGPEKFALDTDVASAATFALGVIGGKQATEQLVQLVADTRADVRYNAATGLARHGRPEAVAVLLEMLALDNRSSYDREGTESARLRKRQMVFVSGIQASEHLLPTASPADRHLLITALQQLRDAKDVSSRIRINAKHTLLRVNAERE